MKRGLAATVLLAFGVAPAGAQDLVGRVVRGGEGLADVPVALHRVTRDSSGVVRAASSGPDGSFRFTPPPPADSGFTVLFATAEWQGVRYFGAPLHPSDRRDRYRVEVYDTASGALLRRTLRLSRRDLILLPEPGNGWEVNEVLTVENPGRRTVVASDGAASFVFQIPESAEGFEVGEAALGATELRRMGNRVLVLAPLRPGKHEMVVRYRIPQNRRSLAVPVGTRTSAMSLLVRQPAPDLQVRGLAPTAPQTLAGETFQRFSAAGLDSTAVVRIAWRDPAQAPVPPVIAAAGLAGLLLVGGAGMAVRNNHQRRA